MYRTNVSSLINFLFSALHVVAYYFQWNVQQYNSFNVSYVNKIKADERNIRQAVKNEKKKCIQYFSRET
jgi:hypothetical protein